MPVGLVIFISVLLFCVVISDYFVCLELLIFGYGFRFRIYIFCVFFSIFPPSHYIENKKNAQFWAEIAKYGLDFVWEPGKLNYHVQFVRSPWTSTLPEEVVVCVSSTIQSDIHIPNEKEKWRKVRAIFRNFSFIICNTNSSFKFPKPAI